MLEEESQTEISQIWSNGGVQVDPTHTCDVKLPTRSLDWSMNKIPDLTQGGWHI